MHYFRGLCFLKWLKQLIGVCLWKQLLCVGPLFEGGVWGAVVMDCLLQWAITLLGLPHYGCEQAVALSCLLGPVQPKPWFQSSMAAAAGLLYEKKIKNVASLSAHC